MAFRFFFIPAVEPEDATERLNRFCAGHRVSFIEKEFVHDGLSSFWSVCVTWAEKESQEKKASSGQGRVDYKEILSPEQFQQYIALKNLRKTMAEEQGVAPYAVFTNAQLAEMICNNCSSKHSLGQIKGVGATRVEQYGGRFLSELERLRQTVDENQTGPGDGDETSADQPGADS